MAAKACEEMVRKLSVFFAKAIQPHNSQCYQLMEFVFYFCAYLGNEFLKYFRALHNLRTL